MKLAEYTIKKSFSAWVIVLLILLGGLMAYNQLGRFEDPEFVIRQAIIITPYPGADPQTVAVEVTDKIEQAVQSMQEVKKVTSISTRGLSRITVEIGRPFSPSKASLQQVWDKLRRKVSDIQNQLPPDAKPSMVQDDFGDVYAILYAVTGEGYSNRQIQNYVDMLGRELAKVPGVARTAKQAQQDEVIYMDISRAKAKLLGTSLNNVTNMLKRQNMVTSAGDLTSDGMRLAIAPPLQTTTVENIQNLAISVGKPAQTIRLKDIADVYRGYKTPTRMFMYYNGEPAIGFGIANVMGGNVVEMGKAVQARLDELEGMRPVGMQLHVISNQPVSVEESVSGFVVNLAAAVIIVLVVLLAFMGLRSGVIIGTVLVLIVAGTLILMLFDGIAMQRISLGALIIALGMLVDNAIVVTDGILVRLQKGEERMSAINATVKATAWPLLGGTIVGIMAFSAIGLSPSDMGEYAGSLFWVILYSMFLSWLFAITVTPLFCHIFLKVQVNGEQKKSALKDSYARLLHLVLHHRLLSTGIIVTTLVIAVLGFAYVPPGFVPDSQRPQFAVDIYMPEGTEITETRDLVLKVADEVSKKEGVTNIASMVGAGTLRFMLVYGPESGNSGYGQLLVDVDDYHKIPALLESLQRDLPQHYPQASFKAWPFQLGPGGGKKIEAVFIGPDPEVLRALSDQAKQVMAETDGLVAIQDDWHEQVPVLKPQYRMDYAEELGLTQAELNRAIEQTFKGRTISAFREGNDLIPIILRSPASERLSAEQIGSVSVSSPVTGSTVQMNQLISGVDLVWEDAIVKRINRYAAIKAQADPAPGTQTTEVFSRLKPKVEAIPLPAGYKLEWHGEYKSQNDSNKGIASSAPFGFAAMILTVLFMFNGWRQPLVIWLTAPLAVIGVSMGLNLFRTPFEFMALLGFLSLVGMLVKNAIVLVDEADVQIHDGVEPYHAIVNAAMSRARPVILGALTTILGVAPLLSDPFFKSMAVTIMFGLLVATALTLIVVPLFYSLLFRIKVPAE